MLTTDTSIGTNSLCAGCANAIVCKWSDRFIEAEKELKEKTKVNRNLDNDDVYSIMTVNISCKFYRSETANRLFGNNWENIISPCTTPSDSTGTPVGTKVYYTNSDPSVLNTEVTGTTGRNTITNCYD